MFQSRYGEIAADKSIAPSGSERQFGEEATFSTSHGTGKCMSCELKPLLDIGGMTGRMLGDL